MIVDVHTHTFPDFLAEKALKVLVERTGSAISPVGKGTLAGLVSQLQEAGVDRAVVCPIATKPSQFEGILQESIRIRDGERGEEAATRIIPFASVHPYDEEKYKRLGEVAKRGIRGVKLHPFYQQFVLDDPELLDYFRCCRDLGLVVQCHCGWDIGYPFSPICGPERIAHVMREIPDLQFIAAHLGGCMPEDEFSQELMESPVYLDTSILKMNFSRPKVQRMMRNHPTDRLLFATDWPWLSFQDGMDFVRSFGFTDAQVADILGNNACRLLQLLAAL